MLDGVTGGFGSRAIAPGSNPQKVFETLGLNKGNAVGNARGAETSEASRFSEGRSEGTKAERPPPPPPRQTGGADAQSLVQGLLEGAGNGFAQNSAASAQSLYTEAQGLLTGTV